MVSDEAIDRFPDFKEFLRKLEECEGWNESDDIFISRAPGRLDVMGGISDYSGGLVLQLPIDRACFAAVQLQHTSSIHITSLRESRITSEWECPIEQFEAACDILECRKLFVGSEWVGYIAGCLAVLKHAGYLRSPIPGMRLFLTSNVPEGKGVSSSACVEVASMKAIAAALKLNLEDTLLAMLCQTVENRVVGASCGVMDQMTAMMGRKGHLMKLLCQPCQLLGHVPIPDGLQIIGVDSGERHSISGSDFTSVRVGTFMGLKILKAKMDINFLPDLHKHDVEEIVPLLPDFMTGAEFLKEYGDHIDSATELQSEGRYPVKHPTLHPILDMNRVHEFCGLLEKGHESGPRLGTLMQEAHQSYQRMGLDSPMTNALYSLTFNQEQYGIFGGKISGGGSGGTVCVLLDTHFRVQAVNFISQAFRAIGNSNNDPIIFQGSSDGANVFGVVPFKLSSKH